jgi:orotate phosphoribosyltransferase-like protein
MAISDEEKYKRGVISSALSSINANITKSKEDLIFVIDDTQPEENTKNEIIEIINALEGLQEKLSNIVLKNSDDSYIPYM